MSQALTVRDIAAAIEDFAPKSLQESYDNAGLQVGNPDATVSGILLCLDVTEDIVREAEERKCNLIVSTILSFSRDSRKSPEPPRHNVSS